MCGTTVQMWQQLLGGNVAMYCTSPLLHSRRRSQADLFADIVYVFQMAGQTSSNVTLYSAAIQYVIFLVTTGLMLPVIDRFHRRHLLLVGSMLCMALHFAIAGLMATHGHSVPEINGNPILRWEVTDGMAAKGIISCSYIFVGIYGFTWAPTGWVYASEVFPLKWRAKGVGLAAATNWMSVSPAECHKIICSCCL